MGEQLEITVYVRTDKIGSLCEDSFLIDKDEWEEMDNREKDEACREYMYNMMEWGYDAQEVGE